MIPDQTAPKAKLQFTLKAPITNAADDTFCDIFPNLKKKK